MEPQPAATPTLPQILPKVLPAAHPAITKQTVTLNRTLTTAIQADKQSIQLIEHAVMLY
jgi:hypothetical protein